MKSKSPFWVQVHGLPVDKMTKANSESIGHRFGNLLGVEAGADGFLLNRSFLRIRVEVNLNLPLPRGFWFRSKAGEAANRWIWYKYERLSDFCYACGRIGHDNKECQMVFREEGLTSGYGPEMRTGRARNPSIPGAPLSQQREQAEHRLEELFRQKPSIQYNNDGAWVTNHQGGHVFHNVSQNNSTSVIEVRSLHSHDRVDVLETPGVNTSKNQGKIPDLSLNPLHLVPPLPLK